MPSNKNQKQTNSSKRVANIVKIYDDVTIIWTKNDFEKNIF